MIKVLLLVLVWGMFILGTNMTDPEKYDFIHKLTEIVTKYTTRNSQSYEEYTKRREKAGWTLLIIALILFLAIMAA